MGTLSDVQIQEEVDRKRLVVENFIRENLHQACYELRMGNVYYDLSEGNRRIELLPGKRVLIKPFHRVVLITQESLQIPNDMIARIVSKGSLFSVGLSPVSTYADPGFSGQIGIVTQNISDRYIELPVGESIAKVEFSTLTGVVREPYQGQHGFQTSIWPIKTQMQKTFEDVKGDSRVQDELEEAFKVTPAATVKLLRRLQRQQYWVFGMVVLSLVLNSLLIYSAGQAREQGLALAVNLLSSLIVVGIGLFFRLPKG